MNSVKEFQQRTSGDSPKVSSAIRIGCAGWAIPKYASTFFSLEGSQLERYAGRFPAVEINSSFYGSHQPQTYRRWARSVPEGFQFAVKVSREITHQRRLRNPELLNRFVAETQELGPKLGPWLLQLPSILSFTVVQAKAFFSGLRDRFAGAVVCEPRHASWFTEEVSDLLSKFSVARVAADPALSPAAARPGGWSGLAYYRLHGAPHRYYSSYATSWIKELSRQLARDARSGASVWCIFDNTARGAATGNALALMQELRQLVV